MHIPNGMLEGTICPVTATISAIGIAGAAFAAMKTKEKPRASRFAAITAFLFAAQMMNFPIQSGTSGHLIGGVLASALLGTPFGILAMGLVIAIQCLVFSDGGFSVLGANMLNMAIMGAGLGGLVRTKFVQSFEFKSIQRAAIVGIVAWSSVMAAAFACSLELAISGTIGFSQVIVAMLGAHALIGVGEGIITLAAYYLFAEETLVPSSKWSVGVPLLASCMIAGVLSPFASGSPDGLEWVAGKYQFLHSAAPTLMSPLPNYTVPMIPEGALSTGLAGMIGVLAVFLLGGFLTGMMKRFSLKVTAAER